MASVLPDINIDFEPERHTYSLHGVRLKSVTQIMEPMSLMLYSGIPSSTLDDAADRGTRAHEQVSNYVTYGVIETDEDTEGYVNAFLDFEAHYKPTWAGSEIRTYHKTMMYAGTIDLLGWIEPDDGTGLDVIDIKCTAEFHPVMLSVQVSAYAEALKSHGVKVRRRYGLQLLKSGEWRFELLQDGYKTFLHCLGVVNAMAAEKRP